MRISIDNLDGGGARDYTGAVLADAPVTIKRALNEADRCSLDVLVGANGLPMPSRHARVAVNADSGAELFAGYLAAQPVRVYVGEASEGAVYRAKLSAVSGVVRDGAAGSVTLAVNDGDGVLQIAALTNDRARELVSDVTLSGAEEPAAYVSEVFTGDGTTAVFALSDVAFRDSERVLLLDRFDEAAIDAKRWALQDTPECLSLSGDGLTMNGGNGSDGGALLVATKPVEMSGSVLVEMKGVVLGAASLGVLGGMYIGTPLVASCFAGFRVRQESGATVVVPLWDEAEVGTVFTPAAGHRYTLRMRLHCVEMVRVTQRYTCLIDGVAQDFGSTSEVAAPMDVVFEVVDEGDASNTPAMVLYDSVAVGAPVNDAPATCYFAVANVAQMFASVESVEVSRSGSVWVVSTLADGSKQTRLMGSADEGVDCVVTYGSTNGAPTKITFLPGRVPGAGEHVTVFYRGVGRAVARLADAAMLTAEVAAGVVGAGRWQGKVVSPAARTSVDCEHAAQALLAMSASRSSEVVGTFSAMNPSFDAKPGDVLQMTSDGVSTALMVRSVEMVDGHAVPEVRKYKIAFANDWATQVAFGIGLRMSDGVAEDAIEPETAANAPAVTLDSLQSLQVTALSESTLQLDAGIDAPSGGGFEVRRRDWVFGPGSDADLVLRSPVRSFAVPRGAAKEKFFVRAYDGSAEPVYSRFSAAVVVNAPV